MNRHHLIAIMSATLLGLFLADAAHAMYHPRFARFVNRDPHGMQVGAHPATTQRAAGGPMTARNPFITRDHMDTSLQYADGMDLYQYVRSNPVNGRDPLGLEAEFRVDIIRGVDPGSIAATINLRVPKGCCRSVRWLQMVSEHQVTRLRSSESRWIVDGRGWSGLPPYTPWYTNSSFDNTQPDRSTASHDYFKMEDEPGSPSWWHMAFRQDFETCAICVTGQNSTTRGKVLGCVRWGHTWARGSIYGEGMPDRHVWYGDMRTWQPGEMARGPARAVVAEFGAMWNGFPIDLNVALLPTTQ